MSDIPERAAWLDHEVTFVSSPSMFEITRLGLENDSVFLLERQVNLRYDRGGGAAMIVVRNVEIVSTNEETGDINFRINGITNFVQPWDTGGSHLDPQGSWHEIA